MRHCRKKSGPARLGLPSDYAANTESTYHHPDNLANEGGLFDCEQEASPEAETHDRQRLRLFPSPDDQASPLEALTSLLELTRDRLLSMADDRVPRPVRSTIMSVDNEDVEDWKPDVARLKREQSIRQSREYSVASCIDRKL